MNLVSGFIINIFQKFLIFGFFIKLGLVMKSPRNAHILFGNQKNLHSFCFEMTSKMVQASFIMFSFSEKTETVTTLSPHDQSDYIFCEEFYFYKFWLWNSTPEATVIPIVSLAQLSSHHSVLQKQNMY